MTGIGDFLTTEFVEYTHKAAEGGLIHNNEIDVLGRSLERRLVRCNRINTGEIRLNLRLGVICDLPKFALNITMAESFTRAYRVSGDILNQTTNESIRSSRYR